MECCSKGTLLHARLARPPQSTPQNVACSSISTMYTSYHLSCSGRDKTEGQKRSVCCTPFMLAFRPLCTASIRPSTCI